MLLQKEINTKLNNIYLINSKINLFYIRIIINLLNYDLKNIMTTFSFKNNIYVYLRYRKLRFAVL